MNTVVPGQLRRICASHLAGKRWASHRCRVPNSAQIRRRFLDYFSQRDHQVVPSVPLMPTVHDPSLLFVNAGMNAWKRHLVGEPGAPAPPSPRLANVQKCVRVNDLALVGVDASHHTFFEMLGNWGFDGSYGKKEACAMALDFLTNELKLPRHRLYVTYFKGEDGLLPPDEETREVWRSLGMDDGKILGFGMVDNYWEMGVTGPCGPCTEIHYDHGLVADRGPEDVNRGHDDLVEIWNIVFMEQQREQDGSLKSLPEKHVDAGMGLERLVAAVNGSVSNYDTDLFLPLFQVIQRLTGAPAYGGSFSSDTDKRYRMLADHSRMVSACLADSMFPDLNHRLKNVIRRCLVAGINDADYQSTCHLLVELCRANADILGHQYPELHDHFDRVPIILEHEAEILKQLQRSGNAAMVKIKHTCPDLAGMIEPRDGAMYREALLILSRDGAKVIDGPLAFRLYESTGIQSEQIEILAKATGLKFDRRLFDLELTNIQSRSKQRTTDSGGFVYKGKWLDSKSLKAIPSTDDSLRLVHERKSGKSHYALPMAEAKILGFVLNFDNGHGNLTVEVGKSASVDASTGTCAVILDRTTFYSQAGGQASDIGKLVGSRDNTTFLVRDCIRMPSGHILHVGQMMATPGNEGSPMLKNGIRVKAKIDASHRISCMQNHTATHVLNSVLHSSLPLTWQRSSHVTSTYFRFAFSIYAAKFDVDAVARLESEVNRIIGQGGKVDVFHVDGGVDKVLPALRQRTSCNRDDVTGSESWWTNDNESHQPDGTIDFSKLVTVPGESYPTDRVRVVQLPNGHAEPCCGSHVTEVADIQAFAVVSCRTPSTGVKLLKCVTGCRALDARRAGIELLDRVTEINDQLQILDNDDKVKVDDNMTAADLLQRVAKLQRFHAKDDVKIPHTVRCEVDAILRQLTRHLKSMDRSSARHRMEAELEQAMEDQTHLPFLVHAFEETTAATQVPLSKLTGMCKDKPVLVVSRSNKGEVSARAVVPTEATAASASEWLRMAVSCHFPPNSAKNISTPKGQDPTRVVNLKQRKVADTELASQQVIDRTIRSAIEYGKMKFDDEEAAAA